MIRNNVRGRLFHVSPENAFFGAGRYPAIWLFLRNDESDHLLLDKKNPNGIASLEMAGSQIWFSRVCPDS